MSCGGTARGKLRSLWSRCRVVGILVLWGGFGCGGDNDGPKVYKTGSHALDGTCRDDGIKTYRVRPGSDGPLDITLVWDESGGADLDLTVWAYADGDLELHADDWNVPPGDSPAEISTTVSDGVRYDVDVECYGDTAGLAYDVTIVVP